MDYKEKTKDTLKTSKNIVIGTFNARTLKLKWRRLEFAVWCEYKRVDVLGVQEHSLRFEDTGSEQRTEALGN